MSALKIEFSGIELSCIYACVEKEFSNLEYELNEKSTLSSDKNTILQSIQTCKNVISKLTSDSDSSYRVCK